MISWGFSLLQVSRCLSVIAWWALVGQFGQGNSQRVELDKLGGGSSVSFWIVNTAQITGDYRRFKAGYSATPR